MSPDGAAAGYANRSYNVNDQQPPNYPDTTQPTLANLAAGYQQQRDPNRTASNQQLYGSDRVTSARPHHQTAGPPAPQYATTAAVNNSQGHIGAANVAMADDDVGSVSSGYEHRLEDYQEPEQFSDGATVV